MILITRAFRKEMNFFHELYWMKYSRFFANIPDDSIPTFFVSKILGIISY
jgi:hypothetical protein